jgi:hypothetical protein
MNKEKILQVVACLLGLLVATMALIVWLQGLNGQFDSLSIYQIFPLLGLIAFSLMWTHYVLGAAKRLLGIEEKSLKPYFEVTSFIVLLAIVLHPGLLVYQLWADGFGLPPGSVYENYVAPSLKWAVTLGPISLAIFIAYELRRKFGHEKWWKFVGYAQLAAMAAIFIHALKLGSHLQDWYLAIWWFFGATLAASITYTELNKRGLVTSLKNRNNKSIGGAA